MKWQPIETAPRDGTDIFIWSHIINKPISVHWRSDDGGDWFISDCLPYCIDPYPTHWMPLPPPPQTDTATPVSSSPAPCRMAEVDRLRSKLTEFSNLSDKPDDYEFWDSLWGGYHGADMSNSGDVIDAAKAECEHKIAVEARNFLKQEGGRLKVHDTLCPACYGRGYAQDSNGDVVKSGSMVDCSSCDGSGRAKPINPRLGLYEACTQCNGTGKESK